MTTLLAFALGAALVLAAVILRSRLASFRAQRPQDYASDAPAFDLTRHLSGPLVLEGVIHGPTGRVTSRFVATAQGSWTGDAEGATGTLREQFRYDSGAVQDREWTLRLGPGGQITGTAPDVLGQATGRVMGTSVQMRYRLRLTAEAGGHELDVVDWMYLLDNGSIMNRSQFSKFGLTVAELVATIRPVPAAAAARSQAAE